MQLITGVHVFQHQKAPPLAPQNGINRSRRNAYGAALHLPFQMVVQFVQIFAVGFMGHERKSGVHHVFQQMFGITVVDLRRFQGAGRRIVHQPPQNFNVGRLFSVRIPRRHLILLNVKQIVAGNFVIGKILFDVIDDPLQFHSSVFFLQFGIKPLGRIIIPDHSFQKLMLFGLLVVNIGTQLGKSAADGNRVQPDPFKAVFVA